MISKYNACCFSVEVLRCSLAHNRCHNLNYYHQSFTPPVKQCSTSVSSHAQGPASGSELRYQNAASSLCVAALGVDVDALYISPCSTFQPRGCAIFMTGNSGTSAASGEMQQTLGQRFVFFVFSFQPGRHMRVSQPAGLWSSARCLC